MKTFVLCMVIFASMSAFARSNIQGTWINQDQTLSIQILDDPAGPPFVAGEIWRAMKGSGVNKAVTTGNFDLRCSAVTQTDGTHFGNCKIRVARAIVREQGLEINFAISRAEARAALAEFNQPLPLESISIKSGITDAYGKDLFLFGIDWRFEMIASVINKSLVTN